MMILFDVTYYQDFGAFPVTTEKKSRREERETNLVARLLKSVVNFLPSTKSLSRFIRGIFILDVSHKRDAITRLDCLSVSAFVFQARLMMKPDIHRVQRNKYIST
jgi:hypothetical protein